jgi:DNA-binding NtrC family response regulator
MTRILLIDDDEQVRGMVKRMLARAGYADVVEAGDGAAGMRLLGREPFDLVITDIIMPGQEGIETIMELSRDYPRIKIIAMSGGGRIDPRGYLETASHLGANRTLAKPFKSSDLIGVVTELLKEQLSDQRRDAGA